MSGQPRYPRDCTCLVGRVTGEQYVQPDCPIHAVSDSVSPDCTVCGGSGSVYVGDHDGAARWRTCDCAKPAVSPPTRPARPDLDAIRERLNEQRKGCAQWSHWMECIPLSFDEVEWLLDALVVAEAARNTAEQDADRLAAVLRVLIDGGAHHRGLATLLSAHAAAVAGRVVPTGGEQ